MRLSELYRHLLDAAVDGDVMGEAVVSIPRYDLRAALAELEQTGVIEPRGAIAAGDVEVLCASHADRTEKEFWRTEVAEVEAKRRAVFEAEEVASMVRDLAQKVDHCGKTLGDLSKHLGVTT